MHKIILLPFVAGAVNTMAMLGMSHFDVSMADVTSTVSSVAPSMEDVGETLSEVEQSGDLFEPAETREVQTPTSSFRDMPESGIGMSVAAPSPMLPSSETTPAPGIDLGSVEADDFAQVVPGKLVVPQVDRNLTRLTEPSAPPVGAQVENPEVTRKPQYARFVTGHEGEITQGFFEDETNTMIVVHRDAVTVEAGTYPYFGNEWRIDDYPGFCGTVIRLERNDSLTFWAPAIGGPTAELLAPASDLGQERIYRDEVDLPEDMKATAWVVCVDRHLDGERPFERGNLLGWLNNLSLGEGSNLS